MKMKYDESDNTLIRASRVMTDKVTDFIGVSPFFFSPLVGGGHFWPAVGMTL